jgi:hypothetical protein
MTRDHARAHTRHYVFAELLNMFANLQMEYVREQYAAVPYVHCNRGCTTNDEHLCFWFTRIDLVQKCNDQCRGFVGEPVVCNHQHNIFACNDTSELQTRVTLIAYLHTWAQLSAPAAASVVGSRTRGCRATVPAADALTHTF